jgi:uncharacterized protein (TIGR00255 family)
MTGFGNIEFEWNKQKMNIQIKAINSKNMDIRFRLPKILANLESGLRRISFEKLIRGKIEVIIAFERESEIIRYSLNNELIKKYYSELLLVQQDLGIEKDANLFDSILALPNVLIPNETELTEKDIMLIQDYFDRVVEQVMQFRKDEGKALHQDILKNIQHILRLLDEIIPYEEKRIERIKERLNKNLEEIEKDSNRFEQEIIYYIDKLDINEEKIRLRKHCEYFIETLDSAISEGKKLGFIAQEILREINTLGSKANDADIQKIVVNMKSELEKVKEQLANVL